MATLVLAAVVLQQSVLVNVVPSDTAISHPHVQPCSPVDWAFLLFCEVLSPERGLFALTFDEGGGNAFYAPLEGPTDGPSSDGCTEDLRFIGILLAKLLILEDVALEFALCPTLVDLLYHGTDPKVPPRMRALVEGFHSAISPTFMSLFGHGGWPSYAAMPTHNTLARHAQRRCASDYELFLKVLQRYHVEVNEKLPSGALASWESYRRLVKTQMLYCKSLVHL